MQIITAYANYLSERGLSEEVCKLYNLEWTTDGRLKIPVTDLYGDVLFYKYRRNPYLTTGPKYTYDKGAKASLFGIQERASNVFRIIVCEGELDAILITDKFAKDGIIGVSSTGGCGTWDESWNRELGDESMPIEVYVCYDSDEPGILGAIKVHKKIPGSKLIFLPQNMKVKPKDITEMYQMDPDKFRERITKMIEQAVEIGEWPTEVTEHKKKELQSKWLATMRLFNSTKRDNYWVHIAQKHINNLPVYKPTSKKNLTGGQDLMVAKSHKITDFMRFRQNKAKCIWHEDGSPSLTYYPANNTVYCFGCQKAGDAIDVYMQLNKVSFKDAVKALNTS